MPGPSVVAILVSVLCQPALLTVCFNPSSNIYISAFRSTVLLVLHSAPFPPNPASMKRNFDDKMVVQERRDERTPLLIHDRPPSCYSSSSSSLLDDGDDDSLCSTSTCSSPVEPVPLNKISKSDLVWVLTGLWSAVFLGALDGVCSKYPEASDVLTPASRP